LQNDKKYLDLFLKIQEFVESQPKVLVHGDCNSSNIFQKTIIDLDDCNFSPFGWDFAYALNEYLIRTDSNILSSLKKVYSFISDYDFSENEKINISYFYMIRIQKYLSVKDLEKWIFSLNNKIKSYNNNKVKILKKK